jgi:chorismate synthase
MGLNFESAGESHGRGIVGMLTGMPHGLAIDHERIAKALEARRRGWGRSPRQAFEEDRVEWLGGVNAGHTTGAPLAFLVPNKENRLDRMPPINRPRPGHADLAGMIRYGLTDARDVLERSSARETVARVVAGTVAAQLLDTVGTRVVGFVRAIGGIVADWVPDSVDDLVAARDGSAVFCPDTAATKAMITAIDAAGVSGDSLGGIVEIRAHGPLPGLGAHVRPQEKLDGRLARAMMALPAVKGFEIGLGFEAAGRPGSQAHDEIRVEDGRITRRTNRCGGIEGGMTNGEPIVVRIAKKPISTLMEPLPSIDIRDGSATKALVERADTCAVAPLAVIAEAAMAMVLADAVLERTGAVTMDELVGRGAEIRASVPSFGCD